MAETNNKNKRVTVILPRQRGRDKEPYFVGFNGVNYLIPRGEPVEVPDYVAAELRRSDAAERFMDDDKERRRALTEAGRESV